MTLTLPNLTLDTLVPDLRRQFPSLSRMHADQPVVYLDGPAGSQVPQSVIDAISDYYVRCNANRNGHFASSHQTDHLMEDAHRAAAAWFNATDPDETIFGANMTSLTFSFSRALAQAWKPGDEVVVTQLDHDANITPWRMAAKDRGASTRMVRVKKDDATLDLDHFAEQINPRTRLVAVTCASNSVGSRTQVAQLVDIAHRSGAEVYLDAVHLAPHSLIDVQQWQADFVVCSAYKFFGPHVGLLWGRKKRLQSINAYKVRPAPNDTPGKWMTGTQNHAAICGVTAAIDYLCDIGRKLSGQSNLDRRSALTSAFPAIENYEQRLLTRLVAGLSEISGIKVFGITDPNQFAQRVPTIALTVDGRPSAEVAARLGEAGIFAWHGNYYAVEVCDALGQSQHGMVRLGLLHTNTMEEVERTLQAVAKIAQP